MAGSLPNELLQQILTEALLQAGDLPARFQARRAFSRVCSAWHHSVLDPWQEVLVRSASQAAQLAALFETSSLSAAGGASCQPAQSAVRSLHLRLVYRGGAEETGLAQLLLQLSHLESIRVELDVQPAEQDGDRLGEELVAAFAAKDRLKHFGLAAAEPESNLIEISRRTISELVSSWPVLESFALERCRLTRPWNTASIPFKSSTIRSISLSLPNDYDLYPFLIRPLPASVRALSLEHARLTFRNRTGWNIDTALALAAPQLTELRLDGRGPNPNFPQLATGRTSARLTRLEKLTATPAVFGDWPGAVKKMTTLRQLTLTAEAERRPSSLVRAEELGEVMEALPALERVELERGACAEWTVQQERQLRHAAAERSITLIVN